MIHIKARLSRMFVEEKGAQPVKELDKEDSHELGFLEIPVTLFKDEIEFPTKVQP